MDLRKARARYHAQKFQAARRGIEWRLTFEQWLDWWGDDLDRRGPRRDQLSMQRPNDSGAYELGNIRKGTPLDNARTRSAVKQNTGKHRAVTFGRCAQERDADEGLGYASMHSVYGIG